MRLVHRIPAVVASGLIFAMLPWSAPTTDAAPASAAFARDVDIPPVLAAGSATTTAGKRVVAELPARTANFNVAAVTWATGSLPATAQVQYSVRRGTSWTGWQTATQESNETGRARQGTTAIYTGNAVGIRVRILSTQAVVKPSVTLIDSRKIPAKVNAAKATAKSSLAQPRATATTVPDFIPAPSTPGASWGYARMSPSYLYPGITGRSDWGADESWVGKGDRSCLFEHSKLRGAVIHHTAGANDYTRAEAPGLVRGIYYYHAVTLDWCDIGYNFLVDKFGTIYEGRTNSTYGSPRGAHALWANTESTGVAILMNSDTAAVTPEARESVARITAWKLNANALSPWQSASYWDGSKEYRAMAVAGHRDVVYTTGCPGNDLGAQLPWIRSRASEMVEATYLGALMTGAPNQAAAGREIDVTVTINRPITGQVIIQRLAPDGSFVPILSQRRDVASAAPFNFRLPKTGPGAYNYRIRVVSPGWTEGISLFHTVVYV